ncbi:helix-turn-helix domain-containing protein [Bradymonadaceae bacterium TMQ3]|nr:helix-turn-helix domain-containing protein [Bradymonadaceae bacterium TMQ3]TXC76491.1 helix-turn-helix domain-containing protein [Bradymonadales bacterium TMQ1]
MNCLECNAPMNQHTDEVPYHALPGTLLRGVTHRTCPSCGASEVDIPRIAELNRTIARALICQRARLSGPQVRFLRKHLGLSGTDVAARMGVSKATVSRWESNKQHISPGHDRLLRLMVAYEEPIENYAEHLASVAQEDAGVTDLTINLWESDQRWHRSEPVRS